MIDSELYEEGLGDRTFQTKNIYQTVFAKKLLEIKELLKNGQYAQSQSLIVHLLTHTDFAKVSCSKTDIVYLLHNLAYTEFFTQDFLQGFVQAQINTVHFTKINELKGITQSYTLESAFSFKLGDLKYCIEVSEKAIQFASNKLNQEARTISPLVNQTAAHFALGAYHKAYTNYLMILDICERNNQFQSFPTLFYNMIYCLLAQDREALAQEEIINFKEKLKKLELPEKQNIWLKFSYCELYIYKKQYQKVLDIAIKLLSVNKKQNEAVWLTRATLYKLIALVELGQNRKGFELAIDFLKRGLKTDSLDIQFNSYWHICRVCLNEKENSKEYLASPELQEFNGNLLSCLKKTERIAENIEKINYKKVISELLKEYYENIHDFKEALFYHKKVENVKDQINDLKNKDLVYRLQEEYLAKKREQKLLLEQKTINKGLETFASIAAHDLKAPLRTIIGFCQILKQKTYKSLEKRDKELWDLVINGGKRMEQLIQDILNFSKLGTKLPPLTDIDLEQLINHVLQNLSNKITKENAQINVIAQLPTIKGHPTLLLQLFQNLIGNALKFQKENITPIVTIDYKSPNKHNQYQHLFSIKDNGIGIPNEKIDTIFDAFVRINNRVQYEGSGLGLATCKKIVETYNGKIWVESILKEGTIFFFSFPQQDQTNSA